MRRIEVIVRRECKCDPVLEAMRPMEASQIILFKIQVASSRRLVVRSVGNLVVILANGSNPAELILCRGIIKERQKASHAARLIVNHLRNRRCKPQLRSAPIDTRVVS